MPKVHSMIKELTNIHSGDNDDCSSNAVGESLRVIVSLNMSTYGDRYCDSRIGTLR
jgi:hypothetical protein